MDTGFKDLIKPNKPAKKIKSPFNFDAPPYDQRSGCYVNAGSHYGEGFRAPVGTEGNPKADAATLPKGRVKTMVTNYLPPLKNLDLDIDQ